MKKISIVVPIYNCENTIDRCIESLINQTYTNIEIILINDGSTDSSEEKCIKYTNNDSRITLISKANEGVSKARNIGIKKANSEYIMFVDSDDYVQVDMCERLLEAINNNEYDVVISGYERVFLFNNRVRSNLIIKPKYGNIKTVDQYKQRWCELYEKSFFNAPWAKLYKTEIIKNNNITFKEHLECGEDLLFNLEYFKYVKNISLIDEAFYIYECTEKESLTTRYDSDKDSNDRLLYNSTLLYLKSKGMINQCKHSVALIYMRSCFRTFEQILYGKNKLNKSEKKSKIKKIISYRETVDSMCATKMSGIENIMYYLVLKSNIYYLIVFFTKIRLSYKNIIRKGFKL